LKTHLQQKQSPTSISIFNKYFQLRIKKDAKLKKCATEKPSKVFQTLNIILTGMV